MKIINLFKKRSGATNDSFLQNYANKDKFFVRTATWDWLNKTEICVVKKKDGKPAMITMDFWLQEIFLDADGQITVTQLVDIARNQLINSKMNVPENISEYLISELERLINDFNIVEFRIDQTQLDPSIALPISQQLK